MDLGRQFDMVMSIGVIHHTDDPDRTFANLYRHCKPGGTVVIWTYSAEGNALVRFLVEPLRKAVLKHLPRKALSAVSKAITALLYPPVYTVYMIPFLRFLPYYDYFGNFRRLSFKRNVLNVFDKLNAPQVRFTTLAKCREWFNEARFDQPSISITRYKGVNYSLSGRKTIGGQT
jgi:SAM-dependent methyltransferase